MSARLARIRCLALFAPSLAAVGLLGGCATFGGNVKGSFACTAPAGVCAPSSTIDDRALAMISGDAGDMAIPAGPFVPSPAQARRSTVAAIRPVPPAAATSRSSERVLRVVFQPYIDEYGRLHEASAVRAVVRGEWQTAATAPSAVRLLDPAQASPSLAEAVDRDEPPVALTAADPDLPDLAVVAAARARKIDPVGEIKADVVARLAARPRHGLAARRASPAVARAASASPPVSPAPVAAARVSEAPVAVRPSALSAEAAAARVRSDPRWTSAAAAAPAAARAAAGTAAGAPVIRATSFPGVTNEEN